MLRKLVAVVISLSFNSSVWASSSAVQTTAPGGPGLVTLNSANCDAIGIVEVGSNYKDVDPSRPDLTEVGSGTLIKIAATNHILVLTASHVVGGDQLWAKVNGRVVAPLRWLLDTDRDVAVLDLGEVDAEPAFVFDQTKQLTTTTDFAQQLKAGSLALASLGAFDIQGFSHNLVFVLTPWAVRGVENGNLQFASTTISPFLALTGNGINSNFDGTVLNAMSKVTGGTSGSLAFDAATGIAKGIIVQSHYYLSETHLAAMSVISKLVDLFETGQSGSFSATVWKMHKGLTFRKMTDGWEEANFTDRPTGNGIVGQPGNGVVGQPGNGVIGQPGDGASSFSPWNQSPRAIFEHYGIQPGLRWQGQSIVGFHVTSQGDYRWPAEFNLYADAETLLFLRENSSTLKFEPISAAGLDYIALLRHRAHADGATRIVSLRHEDGPLLKPTTGVFNVNIFADRVKLQVTTFSRYSDKQLALVPDQVELTLFKTGAESIDQSFLPIVQIRGKSSGLYTIDLRRLFFADLSEITRPMALQQPSDDSDFTQAARLIGDTKLKSQCEEIGFSVRNVDSHLQFNYGFVAP